MKHKVIAALVLAGMSFTAKAMPNGVEGPENMYVSQDMAFSDSVLMCHIITGDDQQPCLTRYTDEFYGAQLAGVGSNFYYGIAGGMREDAAHMYMKGVKCEKAGRACDAYAALMLSHFYMGWDSYTLNGRNIIVKEGK